MSDAVDRGMTVTEMAPMVQAIDVSPETTTAFVGRTLRGPLNEPVLVKGVGDFRRRFGDVWSRSSLGPAVQQFFGHGGQALYVVRVANKARGALLCLPADGSALVLRAVEPGSTELIRAAVDLDGLDPENDHLFNLTLQRMDPATGHVIDQEYYKGASYREDSANFVADALLDSALAHVERPYPRHRPEPTQRPFSVEADTYIEAAQEGSDGDEISDYDLIGSSADKTGLFALSDIDGLDVLYLPPPGKARNLGVTSLLAAELFCRKRGAMLIVDPQREWKSVSRAVAGVRALGLASANAITYFPHACLRSDEDRMPRAIGGAIAGLLSKLDRTEGPWVSFDHRGLSLSRDLVAAIDLEEDDIRLLARHGLNAIAKGDLGRLQVAGSVTMDGSREPHRAILPVRRLCLQVLAAIERATRWAVFEPDGRRAARVVHAQVNAHLSALRGLGALEPVHLSVEAESVPGVTILIAFRPAGWSGTISYTIHQTANGCRSAPTAFAPVMESCA